MWVYTGNLKLRNPFSQPHGTPKQKCQEILFPDLPSDPPSLHHRIWSFPGRFVESSTGKLGPDKADSESFLMLQEVVNG